MKDVILEISGLGNRDHRYERQMRVYEQRARKARAEAYALVFGAVGRGIVSAVRGTVSAIRGVARGIHRRHVEKAAVRELSALDDRLLRDIGLERGDIRTVASTLAARNAQEHERAIEHSHHARAESKVASAPRDADQQSTAQKWERAA